ncbi:YrhK family protein [Oceanicola sp. S124]|uniref:YrhK family protein n=1 Tax=Oceanicola sp. S124 TaxID=1042378 RepID=UPI000255A193
MPLFHHENRERNAETRRIYALFEIVYTLVDFLAALCFIVGSVLFFDDSLQRAGTWLFLSARCSSPQSPR